MTDRTTRRAARRRAFPAAPVLATLPMILAGLGLFLVGTLCIVYWSFTSSGAFPHWKWTGTAQYGLLWTNRAWLAAMANLAVYVPATLAANLVIGGLLAICLDRQVRFAGLFHSLFLAPYALSLYVTGLVWQWIFDPRLGLEPMVRSWGWTAFHFAPTTDPAQGVTGLVIAGCWQSIGLTMAILLAGLRAMDSEIWAATRIDGIPTPTAYLHIILPMLKGPIATALLLQIVAALRTYDLVVAMTDDPNKTVWMPAVYVIKAVWYDVTLRQGAAAATMLLLPIVVLLVGARVYRRFRPKPGGP